MSGFNDLLFELRTWDTERLRVERARVIVERRKLRTRELALTRVLDERDALAKDQAARDGETEAQSQRKRATAKKLEHLPNLGDAAMNGELSDEQLEPAADLADEDSDEEVAATAKSASPQALQRMAREKRRERDREQARRSSVHRRNQRYLRKFRDDDGFLVGSFALPMEHGGAVVESFFDQVTQRMRPRTGEAWEPLDRRQADVLIGLCQLESDEHGRAREEDRAREATVGGRVDVHVDIRLDGEATMCGVALPDEWVDAARERAGAPACARSRRQVGARGAGAVVRVAETPPGGGPTRWPLPVAGVWAATTTAGPSPAPRELGWP